MSISVIALLALFASTADALSCPSRAHIQKKGRTADGARVEWCELNGQRDGRYREYYKDGTARLRSDYKQGVRDGRFRSFHPNGRRRSQGRYSAGKHSGEWTRWFENGKRQDEGTWREGRPEGHWKAWHPTGKTRFVGSFLNGQRTGEWAFFNERGVRTSRGFYQNDQKVCAWTEWKDGARSSRTFASPKGGCPGWERKGFTLGRPNFALSYLSLGSDGRFIHVPGVQFGWDPMWISPWKWFRVQLGFNVFHFTVPAGQDVSRITLTGIEAQIMGSFLIYNLVYLEGGLSGVYQFNSNPALGPVFGAGVEFGRAAWINEVYGQVMGHQATYEDVLRRPYDMSVRIGIRLWL